MCGQAVQDRPDGEWGLLIQVEPDAGLLRFARRYRPPAVQHSVLRIFTRRDARALERPCPLARRTSARLSREKVLPLRARVARAERAAGIRSVTAEGSRGAARSPGTARWRGGMDC